MVSLESHSFEIPEYHCGSYGVFMGVRLGLLTVALGAAWYVLGKEISRHGLTTLREVTMLLNTNSSNTGGHNG